MALLSVIRRKAIFKYLGLGEYNKKNIKAFQKKYMLRKSDWDGIYGQNTDNTLRTVYFTKRYCKNFKPEEFRCECGGKYCCGYPSFMKPAMLKHIQAIRDHYDEPIVVTCGLRCKVWNSKLGGSIQNSLHLQGLAVDFYQSGVTDPLSKRKKSIKWIAKQKNHHYTYGNGIYRLTTDKTYSGSVSAPYMGNALHTDVYDNVKATYPKYEESDKESDKETDKKPSKPSVYKVIDVSDWQSKIDWEKVKADGTVGAIIRYADGDVLDKRFIENMVNAKKAGLHVGSYIFSRAKTKAQAEKEAERLYTACRLFDPDMPLYIDLEDAKLSKYADTVASAFLDKMKKLGGWGGVYANLNWWNNYLTDTIKNYSDSPLWIAQYNDKITHKKPKLFGMWQYSSSGSVDGISGRVDMNRCYRAYWEEASKHISKADPLQPWYDAMTDQYNWSKNQKYEFNTKPTVANSKEEGTCITFVSVSLQRLELLPQGKYFYLYPKTNKIAGNGASYVKEHTEIYKVSYPNKTIAQLVAEGAIKKGDIVGYDDPGYHTQVFMGLNEDGEPIFNTMGHTKGLGITYPRYADRKVAMLVRLKKVVK